MNKSIINIKIKSSQKQIFKIYSSFIKKILNKLKINYSFFCFPNHKKKFTLLRSPHVYKKSREQFQFLTFKCLFKISSNFNNFYLKYLMLNKPSEIKLSIHTKI